MKVKKGFVLRDVCGEKVLVAEGTGMVNFNKLVSLNETAAWLWQKATELGHFDGQQLADALCEEYDVAPEQARADVDKMTAEWQQIGIIE